MHTPTRVVINLMEKTCGNTKILWKQPHIRQSNKQQFYCNLVILSSKSLLSGIPCSYVPEIKLEARVQEFATLSIFSKDRDNLDSVMWDHAICMFTEHRDDSFLHTAYDPKVIRVKKSSAAGLNGLWIWPDKRLHLKYFWFCKGQLYKFHCCTANFIYFI